ncbi:MAG: hypothetical protein IPL22_12075 [Bacteroidetes bacterium]|nr:hypothetical protein [Bacteroidota bacterium]
MWAKSHGGSDWDIGLSIKSDVSGNVFVTGYFKSSAINFGSISLTNSSGSSFSDLFLVKYDSNGNVLWAQNPQGLFNKSGNDLATDVNGNVYITGYYQGPTLDFGTITVTNNSLHTAIRLRQNMTTMVMLYGPTPQVVHFMMLAMEFQ